MVYTLNNGESVTITINHKPANVRAYIMHTKEGTVGYDTKHGHDITTDFGLSLSTYTNEKTGIVYILDKESGIAISEAYTQKDAVLRVIKMLNNNGVTHFIDLVKLGRKNTFEHFCKYDPELKENPAKYLGLKKED
jgi:hypothetical protein